MSAKKKKKLSGQGINFAVSVVTISVIFVFVGYLIGQYAVNMLQQQHQESLQLAREELVAPVVTSSPNPPPSAPTPTPSPAASTVLYRVQVGVFSEKANADRMVTLLKEAGYEALIVQGPPHRVQTGAFSSQENATKLMEELKQKGFEAIIVR